MLEVGGGFAGYTIERLLGAGGMGEVYLARHPRLPRRDALKILRPELSTDPDFRARFIREADLAATLTHPHIVSVHDRGEHNGQLWIANQYIAGTDAAQLLRSRYPAGMPVEDAIAIITAIAGALDYAHDRGLLHRDVKPANILLSEPDRTRRRQVYLADFGIARPLADGNGLTATNTTLGTFAYSAPEQLIGDEIDGRADQYALAATAYHLLAGAPPFNASTNPVALISKHLNATPPPLSQHRPELAPLNAVLALGLAKDPAHRYRSCADFASALVEGANLASHVSPHSETQAAATARADLPASGPAQQASDTTKAEPQPVAQPQPGSPRRSVTLPRAQVNAAIAVAAVIGMLVLIAWFNSGGRSTPSTSSTVGSAAADAGTAAKPTPRSTASQPATAAAPPRTTNIAGMIVFLDPSGSGSSDSRSSLDVPDGRGGTARCQDSGVATNDGYQGHTFAWDTVLRIRAGLNSLGVRTAMSRGNDNAIGPCVDERAAMANSLSPNAIVSIGVAGEPAGSGFAVQYSKPPLNAAQAGPSISFAEMMRGQLQAAGFSPIARISNNGLDGVATNPELSLAEYPAIKVMLGNVADPTDAQAMQTAEGRQRYADAVIRGVVAFLQTQPPRG